ncbi:MAG: D-2-hydroxyacid dehydrogenase [Kiritimatiellaeota bacterium]|nr:D-2-hydroxyacid dehydrogenase [Kiritimatiellota bacterium]
MKIALLDSHTVSPDGDIDWSGFTSLGECTFYDRTPPALLLERAADADALIINKVVINAASIAALPKCRYIGFFATGMNNVDLDAARAAGITVRNVPAYSTPSVAQMVFAHILAFANRVESHSAGARSGKWSGASDFCYWDSPITELDGLTLGIIGYGAIGKAVATIARAFGMRVIVHTRTRPNDDVEFVERDELFRRSDFISLHCPLTPETDKIINARALSLMKPNAVIINTGRGPLIDESALADALNSGRIAGAGLDVLSREPPPADNPLLSAKNCVITPHIAWASKAARTRLVATAANNLKEWINSLD